MARSFRSRLGDCADMVMKAVHAMIADATERETMQIMRGLT
jgi:hypothetical protein